MNESIVYNSSDINLFNQEFYDKFVNCKRVVFKFYWKPVGDSLLALSLITAILDYLEHIKRKEIEVLIEIEKEYLLNNILKNENVKFISNAIDLFENEAGTILISDLDPMYSRIGNYHYCTEDGRVFPPIVVNKNVYFTRPSRYYARILLELGIDPVRTDNFLPIIEINENKEILEKYQISNKFCLLINYSGEIERKYGLMNYFNLGKKIFKKWGIEPIIVTNGNEEDPFVYRKVKNSGVKILYIKNLLDLMEISEFSEFVVTNDTGASHLLSMIARKSQTRIFSISSRHDHVKWSTGNPYQLSIENRLSKFLTTNHFSLKRDKDKIPLSLVDKVWSCDIKSETIIKTISKYYENNNTSQK